MALSLPDRIRLSCLFEGEGRQLTSINDVWFSVAMVCMVPSGLGFSWNETSFSRFIWSATTDLQWLGSSIPGETSSLSLWTIKWFLFREAAAVLDVLSSLCDINAILAWLPTPPIAWDVALLWLLSAPLPAVSLFPLFFPTRPPLCRLSTRTKVSGHRCG